MPSIKVLHAGEIRRIAIPECYADAISVLENNFGTGISLFWKGKFDKQVYCFAAPSCCTQLQVGNVVNLIQTTTTLMSNAPPCAPPYRAQASCAGGLAAECHIVLGSCYRNMQHAK
jgi:hypothetical protein